MYTRLHYYFRFYFQVSLLIKFAVVTYVLLVSDFDLQQNAMNNEVIIDSCYY